MGAINGVGLIVISGFGNLALSIFGTEYTGLSPYYVLVTLSFMYYMVTWIGPTSALLQVTDGNRVEMVNTIIFVLLNIVLNYILILYAGLLGAALATAISAVTRNILQVVEIYSFYDIHPFDPVNVSIFIVVVIPSLLNTYISYFPLLIVVTLLSLYFVAHIVSNNLSYTELRYLSRAGKYVGVM
jgi:O-antigen/teichoic acid export membrane protein